MRSVWRSRSWCRDARATVPGPWNRRGRRLRASAAGRNNTFVLIDPANGRIRQTLPLSTRKTGDSTNTVTGQLSFTGLVFAPDGRRLYLSNAGGNVWAFAVDDLGRAGKPVVLPVPAARAPKQTLEIPTGLAVSADGRRLYVAGNLGNRLHELDPASGKALRSWDTGVAPQDVVLVGEKAYVSNRGGRRPGEGDPTAPRRHGHHGAGGPRAAHRQ